MYLKVMFLIVLMWPFQCMAVTKDETGQIAFLKAQPAMVVVVPECMPLPED